MPASTSGATKDFGPLSYRDGLDYLEFAYRRGFLVPFVGAGLSAPAIPTWRDFIEKLAGRANEPCTFADGPTDQELILKSERVVSRLRGQGTSLSTAVRDALGCADQPPAATPASRQLASVWWPLVLSTNYDRMFLDTFNKRLSAGASRHARRFDAMAVVGRGAADCRTLLASLGTPVRPLLWALQGFLGTSFNGADLSREIVVGYEQYRDATFHNAGFRAAFGEVFRSRSLLFLGTGLSEDYFRGLFGESLARLGPSEHSHCALINKCDLDSGAVDPWFLHTRLNIVVLTYEDRCQRHDGFAPCLQEIAGVLSKPPRQNERFVFSPRDQPNTTVEVVPTALPQPGNKGRHWIVWSAGRDPATRRIRRSDDANSDPDALVLEEVKGSTRLCRVKGQPVLVAIARNPEGGRSSGKSRDLRTVAEVTKEALDVAVKRHRCTCVSLMLLAASIRHRRWPRVFSLVQMLRGIRWFLLARVPAAQPLRIVIHDTAAAKEIALWAALRSGRLDPEELLGCDAVRCFVEIEEETGVRRTPMYLTDDKTVDRLAAYFHLTHKWQLRIEPSAFSSQRPLSTRRKDSLKDLGIVPGSIIRFSRRPSSGGSAG